MLPKRKSLLSISLVFKIIITAGAYFYIYYRISDSFSENQSFSLIFPFTKSKLLLLIITLLLMTINWLIESFKWQKLLNSIVKISFNKSIISVLVGITCSIFTPYRIGEYFGRPMLMQKEKRTEALLANIIGSISQNIITFGLGILGTILLLFNQTQNIFSFNSKILVLIGLLSLCFLLLFFYFSPNVLIKLAKIIRPLKKIHEKLNFLAKYTKKELLVILILSFSRYLVFFTQYYLLLIFFNVNISLVNAFTAISLSYVFLFSIPGIPIADIGIRGSLALFFLGMYSADDMALVSASSALWIINLALPSIAGTYFMFKIKSFALK